MERIDWEKYDDHWVIAMDETAVYFGEETQTTVDVKGSSSILVPSTGYESSRLTCVLAIRRSGEKLPPMVILKGKRNSLVASNGVIFIESEKAWSTQSVLHK